MEKAHPFELLKEAITNDPDYAWGWFCNIAMPIFDSIPNIKLSAANKAAARIMEDVFEFDISKHPNYTPK